jgi:hypothetical protein
MVVVRVDTVDVGSLEDAAKLAIRKTKVLFDRSKAPLCEAIV